MRLTPTSVAAGVTALVIGVAVAWQLRSQPNPAGSVLSSAALAGVASASPVAPAAAPGVPPTQVVATASPAPLSVEVIRLQPESLEFDVPATGRLVAREQVSLVSELPRRLVRVRAAEGTTVRQGEALFELDAEDLRADLAKLEVQARLAKSTLERTERLLADGLTNRGELDLAQARFDELAAERRRVEVTLAKTTIVAPFSGELGLRRVSEGAMLSPSTVLSTLQDTASLKLDFTLPERYAPLVQKGAAFRFRVEGQPGEFSGRVVAREPVVDAQSRSLLIRGLVAAGAGLTPGASASIALPLRTTEALLVPTLAIAPGMDGRRVFVVRDGTARAVVIDIGQRTPDRVQVLSGLNAGDLVITSQLLRVRDGLPVEPARPEESL